MIEEERLSTWMILCRVDEWKYVLGLGGGGGGDVSVETLDLRSAGAVRAGNHQHSARCHRACLFQLNRTLAQASTQENKGYNCSVCFF